MTQTDIKSAIYSVIKDIPYGRVCSYGRVAELAGVPGSSRFVGRLLKELPIDSQLPWHRVIRSSGQLGFPASSEAYIRQRNLLEQEGITFRADSGKLDINYYSI